ncbi:hypothetical protein HDU92_001528 [Lobulomyces angularis]|nr:hypothetical protein HDU92_001528 [Lobulomyces angularis]
MFQRSSHLSALLMKKFQVSKKESIHQCHSYVLECPSINNSDCQILASWLPSFFNPENCCETTSRSILQCNNQIPPRITVLNLFASRITIDIPKDLTKLNFLTYLNLARTGISGSIPHDIGDLSQLTFLDLSNNNLVGNIPQTLTDLGRLQRLRLNNNLLEGNILKDLGRLMFLTELDFSNNKLTGGIPSEFKYLISLKKLKLGKNLITGPISSTFSALQNLQILDISFNQLSGQIPLYLGQLPNLVLLFLNDNQFSGYLPNFSKKLFNDSKSCNIRKLGSVCLLQGESIDALVPTLCQRDALNNCEDSLATDCEILSRWIPLIFKKENCCITFDTYNYVSCSNGRVTEIVLMEWARLFTSFIEISSHFVSDNFPVPLTFLIARLSSLTKLIIQKGLLSGPIPDSIGNLVNLKDLSANYLHGNLPESFRNLANLNFVTLEGNSFSGNIPESFSALKSLTYFNVKLNFFTGPIPQSFVNLPNLKQLVLHQNFFSGDIPVFPSYFCPFDGEGDKVTDLSSLGESCCYPTGQNLITTFPTLCEHEYEYSSCPEPITDCAVLNKFLNSAHVTYITEEIHSLDQLQHLDISNSIVAGNIPGEIGLLTNLQTLKLSDNRLTGSVPNLSKLVNLKILDLSSNFLDGPLTYQLSALSELTILNLDGNLFDGPLPNLLNLNKLETCQIRGIENICLPKNNSVTDFIPKVCVFTQLNSCSTDCKILKSWLPALIPENCCEVFDNDIIKCDGGGSTARVTSLNLGNQNLNGQISVELSFLTELTELYLNNNNFTGILPDLSALQKITNSIGCNLRNLGKVCVPNGKHYTDLLPPPCSHDNLSDCNRNLTSTSVSSFIVSLSTTSNIQTALQKNSASVITSSVSQPCANKNCLVTTPVFLVQSTITTNGNTQAIDPSDIPISNKSNKVASTLLILLTVLSFFLFLVGFWKLVFFSRKIMEEKKVNSFKKHCPTITVERNPITPTTSMENISLPDLKDNTVYNSKIPYAINPIIADTPRFEISDHVETEKFKLTVSSELNQCNFDSEKLDLLDKVGKGVINQEEFIERISKLEKIANIE